MGSMARTAPALSPAPSGAGGRAARLRPVLVLAAACLLGGCYSYIPLYSVPEPSTRVSLEINDAGRVGLEQNVGPEAASIEGVIQDVTAVDIVVSVTEVRGLRGSRSRWAGEPVTVRRDYVRIIRERRYSSVRTFAMGTVVASATLAFLVTRNLLGGATGPGGDNPPGPIGEQ